jgi:hypothetical protein
VDSPRFIVEGASVDVKVGTRFHYNELRKSYIFAGLGHFKQYTNMIEKACINCKHLNFHHPSYDDPGVWFVCTKGKFDMLDSKEDYDSMHEVNTCDEFSDSSYTDRVTSTAPKISPSLLRGTLKLLSIVFVLLALLVLFLFLDDIGRFGYIKIPYITD